MDHCEMPFCASSVSVLFCKKQNPYNFHQLKGRYLWELFLQTRIEDGAPISTGSVFKGTFLDPSTPAFNCPRPNPNLLVFF